MRGVRARTSSARILKRLAQRSESNARAKLRRRKEKSVTAGMRLGGSVGLLLKSFASVAMTHFWLWLGGRLG
jgi:hypothetical protein